MNINSNFIIKKMLGHCIYCYWAYPNEQTLTIRQIYISSHAIGLSYIQNRNIVVKQNSWLVDHDNLFWKLKKIRFKRKGEISSPSEEKYLNLTFTN